MLSSVSSNHRRCPVELTGSPNIRPTADTALLVLQYTPSKHEALSWLLPIYVAPMVGAYFITTAYIFRTVAAANRDFAARMFEWETGGPARGPK